MPLKLKNSNGHMARVELCGLFHGAAGLKISFGGRYILLYGPLEELASELTRCIEQMQGKTIAQVGARDPGPLDNVRNFPPELEGNPQEAWQWLRKNRPQLFSSDAVTASDAVTRAVCELTGCDSVTSRNAKYCCQAHRQAAYRQRQKAA